MNPIDINIKEVSHRATVGLESSQLVLEFSGESVNPSLVNTFRRIPQEYVPTYAFSQSTVLIDRNTSIFNSNMMKIRLAQFTVPNISHEVDYLDPEYYAEQDLTNPEREKHPLDTLQIDMYVTAKNTTSVNQWVTTNNAKVMINGKEEKKFDEKFPWVILPLRPGEAFNARCVATLGVGLTNDVWSSVANAYFEEMAPNRYIMTWESNTQLTEYDILIKSCRILKHKIEFIKRFVDERYNKADVKAMDRVAIELDGETHTIGGIINDLLQDHPKVVMSGLVKKSLLYDSITITFKTVGKNPLVPLFEVLDHVIAISNVVKAKLEKLKK